MKENLFRGKREGDGKWVFGSLVLILDGSFIWDQRMHHTLEKDLTFAGLDDMLQKVIPETVGQFTGRCIENVDKVFEGDIVKRLLTSNTPDKWEPDRWEMGVVIYNEERTRFVVNVFKQKGFCDYSLPFNFYLHDCDWKIIGNKTDDPEMLDCTVLNEDE